jgi:Zn-dependent metalloprotease
MDPHTSSGIPNLAFYTAAKAIGGNSWETIGQIWYKALTGSAPSPNMTMQTFANLTRQLAAQMVPANANVADAIDAGWTTVGL